MLHASSLPKDTKRLLDAVATCPDITRFTLVGGTALALSWGHRQSEDLDFAIPAHNLPRSSCQAILNHLAADGWGVHDVADPVALEEHELAGSDLADAQQDWLCSHGDGGIGVKLTFFAEYQPSRQAPYQLPAIDYGFMKIMAPDGIFMLKSQLLLRRRAVRDLFDLWAFLERGWTIGDILDRLRAEEKGCSYERLCTLLLPARQRVSDPGLASLVSEGPQDFESVKEALQQHLDAYERKVASEAVLDDEDHGTP